MFSEREPDWGYAQFGKFAEILDKNRGIYHDDSLTIIAKFQRLPDVPAWGTWTTYDSRKETGFVGLRNQGAVRNFDVFFFSFPPFS